MGGIAKQKPTNHQFINCEFEFKCPKNWFDLAPTYDVKVKFCETCNQNVHLCVTQEELDGHAKQRHCIAYFEAPNQSALLKLEREVCETLVPSNRPIMLTGYPVSAKRFSDIFNGDDE